jgi:hypothetical protein
MSMAGGFALPARGAAAPGSPELELFLFDNRFAQAREIARAAAAVDGAALRGFSGDLTELWRDELDLRWRAAPMILGGVTTGHALFVLETLAADRGMRIARRAELAERVGVDWKEALTSWVIAPSRVAGG